MRAHIASLLCALAIAAPLGGCGTPKVVRETASSTAVNASLVNSSLEAFKVTSAQSAESRRQSILPVVETANSLRSDTERRLSALAIVEDKKDRDAGKTVSTFAKSIIADLDATNEREHQAEARNEAFATEMAASYAALDIPSEQLKALAAALSELGKNDSKNEQLKSLRTFLEAAYTLYKDSKDTAASTSASADAKSAKGGPVAEDVKDAAKTCVACPALGETG